MPENKSRPPQDRPWESGWAPDTTRAPGTRRLWLAGALALATVAGCVTAIAIMDNHSDESSHTAQPSVIGSTSPGLISFATPSEDDARTPARHKRKPSPTPTTSPPTRHSTTPAPREKAPKPPAPHRTSPAPKPPAADGTSIRSVNYPDRYWQVSDGSVILASASSSSARRNATFERVPGLADSSCYSFTTADGRYLRHRSFVLVANTNDGSSLFRKDATFCPHYWSPSGTLSLESVNYPGRFLRHRDFQIRLDPYENSYQYHSDASFQMVAGLA